MGIINVEGLGEVQITGDKPNEEEQKIILETLEKMPASDKDINDKTDSFVKSNAFGRLAIEVGLGIGGSLLTGGAAYRGLARYLQHHLPSLPALEDIAPRSHDYDYNVYSSTIESLPIEHILQILRSFCKSLFKTYHSLFNKIHKFIYNFHIFL